MEAKEIIERYTAGESIDSLASDFHFGKLKIKRILNESGIVIRPRGGMKKEEALVVPDWSIEKYPIVNGKHYIAKHKETGKIFNDYMNNGGFLTSYIKEYNKVSIPSLYARRQYYMKTGNYWWEQWFDIILIDNKPVKKCPYCGWETEDTENRSGTFEQHLKKAHNINKIDYLKEYPEDAGYFTLVSHTNNLQLETDEKKYVVCEICGKKLSRIDTRHLSGHGITKLQYIEKYGKPTICKELHSKLSTIAQETNQHMEFHKESNAEREIKKLINSWGINTSKNRKLLKGKEIDIFLPEYKLGIEFNGNFYHTEWGRGKGRNYHLDKTLSCENQGIKLIQIFEDEWMCHKDICIDKIKHTLGLNGNLPKIMARKCSVVTIADYVAKAFLDAYHIQGFCRSTVYLGAYYNTELVAVMTFTKNGGWELSRFATKIDCVCPGIGGKLFQYFVRHYNPSTIKSFADRRWTSPVSNNFYTSIGFSLTGILHPDYRYYNQKIDRYRRFHKFNFRKQRLHKKYGFPLTMTESEMVKELGYDRIWDCGLLKYEWHK